MRIAARSNHTVSGVGTSATQNSACGTIRSDRGTVTMTTAVSGEALPPLRVDPDGTGAPGGGSGSGQSWARVIASAARRMPSVNSSAVAADSGSNSHWIIRPFSRAW